ncbi:hypothetical protein HGM15179_002527 [Zosterops borbonicus]|uniref:LIM zinc-binding domain-containing protein n=1 Tax=Zosterops borbonicus TaxID=364589 RepID=A0A8K1GWE1_9PASS|nr:hypothetical protein HGM15179_002527 [Zosterops borbonicus]
MVNPGGSAQPPPVTAGSLSWKRCAGCGGKIADRFLLYAMDSYWHSRCLKCSCCQAQLGDIGTSCYTKSGMILCRTDYIRLFGNSGACSACGQSIPASELVMRAQGNVYHLKCFTCSTCRNRLVPGDRFHYINGSLFCEHDRPTALINGHLNSLQSNPLLPDQKFQFSRSGSGYLQPCRSRASQELAILAKWKLIQLKNNLRKAEMSLASCWHHKDPQATNIVDPPHPQHHFVGEEGLEGSAGGRAVQLTYTLGFPSVLASEEEHTSTGKQDSSSGLHGRGSHQPISWKSTEDDMKLCFLPSHDGESPDYTWVPYSVSG